MHSRVPSLAWFTPTKTQDRDSLSGPLTAKLESYPSGPSSRPVARAFVNPPHTSGLKVVLVCSSLVAFAVWSALHLVDHTTRQPKLSCNPFSQPGALFLNIENTSSTMWTPFDTSCPASHLLPLVEDILESDAINSARALPWLVNRTVVLIGDSIERFSLDYFCDLMDGELSLIDPDHPYSPPPFRNGRDELKEDEETVKTWMADGRPHWCKITEDGLSINLFSFFMYGSATFAEFEQQESVFRRPHYFAPAETQDRIDHWVVGTLERAGLSADIVQFSSALWDIMHWSEIDSVTAMSQDVVHAPFSSFDRLHWYRDRLSSSLDKIEQTFPDAALVWRRGHDVPCGQFHVPCARNAQFINMADSVIAARSDRWDVDETGRMIRGHTEFFKDKVHPGEAFSGLWADVLFHRLRESYLLKRDARPIPGRFSQRASVK